MAYYMLRSGSDPKAALLPDHLLPCLFFHYGSSVSELAKSVITEYFNYLLVFLIAWSPGNDAKKNL